MKKLLSHAMIALLFLILGIWYGYDRGVKNQLYFDSPGRIALYDAYLKEGDLVKHIEGEIRYQLGLLEGMEDLTSSILLHHPMHVGMKDTFEEYNAKIGDSERVQKIRREIKAYNKKRNEMDGSVEPPIR